MKISTYIIILILSMNSSYAFPGSGSGTMADPYQITNVTELQAIDDEPHAHYILMNNIDASETIGWNDGAGFIPICADINNPFNGSLDGQGYTVKGLYQRRYNENTDKVAFGGLFAHIGPLGVKSAEIKYVRLEDCDIESESAGHLVYAGGLCGYNSGAKVEYCSVEGSVKGKTSSTQKYAMTGGFCGVGQEDFSACYFEGSVVSEGNMAIAGGFLGSMIDGEIIDCYSIANVECRAGIALIGGFCGYLSLGNIVRCFTSSELQTVGSHETYNDIFYGAKQNGYINNCLFDMGINGKIKILPGASGIPRSGMMQKSNYEANDFDFTNVWCIRESQAFPRIQEFSDGECNPLDVIEDNNTKLDIIIYPNPTPGKFIMKIDKCNILKDFTIVNIAGQQIGYQCNYNSSSEIEISIDNPTNSTYYLQASMENGLISKTITVAK